MQFKTYLINTLVILILSIKIANSQTANQFELVQYTPEYKFQDGIFLDFKQVKNNLPILINDINLEEKTTAIDFFGKLLDSKKIDYQDESGNILSVEPDKIWGYSQDGTLNIRWNGEFYRIFNIARFANFIVYENVYINNFNDPFMATDPFMPSISTGNVSKTMKQYMLDFETGNIVDFNVENLSEILTNDKDLTEEYSALSKRKKRQMMFLYLRKYNDKNPLFLPKR